MISKRLTVVAAAGAILLSGVIPAAASAHRTAAATRNARAHLRRHIGQGGSPTGCRLTLASAERKVTNGEAPQLFGRLRCRLGSEAGQSVTLYGRPIGGTATALASASTETGGYYTVIPPAPSTETLYYAVAAGAVSPPRLVDVAPEVTLRGPPEGTTLLTGVRNRVLFSGTVIPADVGAEVVLQREQSVGPENWHAIQRARVEAGGFYAFVHVFRIPGDANIRVIVRPHRRFPVFGASSPISYVVSQAQNPLLTLSPMLAGGAGDPILFSQSITLEGVLAGGSGKLVTLFARNVGGSFSMRGTTTADADGHFSFFQTPEENTAYRVSGAGRSSAVVFEGVKYVLTATASASSAHAGQAVTFSGTVTPYRAGHVVYLERQNASGDGYHVVDVATLTPGPGATGAYSIPHVVFGAGKQVFRVKVPGDPANEGAASMPFAVEVTPGPAAALRPPPPGTLPGEGGT
jgi:hypothetical protein